MFTVKALDLTNTWIVFKRVKRKNWYHRGPNYQVCSTAAGKAAKWSVKAEAEEFCKQMNIGRKSYRFKVESASKHFVNNWTIAYNNWQKEVVIASNPIGIDRLAKLNNWEKYTPELDNQKSVVIEKLTAELNDFDKGIKGVNDTLKTNLDYAKKEYERSIEHYTNQHVASVQALEKNRLKISGMKTALESTNLDTEYVEKLGTEADKKSKILFGKRV